MTKPDASLHDPRAQTPAERVRRSEAKKISEGGRKLAPMILDADAAGALASLERKGYAASVTAIVAQAVKDADKRHP